MIIGGSRQVMRVLAVNLVGTVLVGGLLGAWGAGGEPSEASLVDTVVSEQSAASEPSEVEAKDLAEHMKLSSGLAGGPHDFTQNTSGGSDLCLPCHTPHLGGAPAPLPNEQDDMAPPLRPYRTADLELTGWSLLCLGCHDGEVASDVYSSVHAVGPTDQLASSRLEATDSRSHPVGIVYPVASEDLQPRSAVEAAGLVLPGGRIQCTTCHDAHNTRGYSGMLQISNERSRMCLTCHLR